jgi:hypothetical protein
MAWLAARALRGDGRSNGCGRELSTTIAWLALSLLERERFGVLGASRAAAAAARLGAGVFAMIAKKNTKVSRDIGNWVGLDGFKQLKRCTSGMQKQRSAGRAKLTNKEEFDHWVGRFMSVLAPINMPDGKMVQHAIRLMKHKKTASQQYRYGNTWEQF